MEKKQEDLLNKKNAQLVKELSEKNRELELEASLERVRIVAMSMSTPGDLLNICRSIYKELQLLEFGDLRNVIILTYTDTDYFIDYDYSDFTKGHISHMPYFGNSILEKFVRDIKKTKDAFTEVKITGEKLKEWKNFRDANHEAPDERLNNTPALYYYIYAVGDASIGISTFNAIPADKLKALKRFRNIFDLAYRRYKDIGLALEQAKEARIEIALERVRAVAMAMKNPEELYDVCKVTYTQLQALGFTSIRNAQISIFSEGTDLNTAFEHSDNSSIKGTVTPLSSHPMLVEIANEIKISKDALFQKTISGEEFTTWRKWRNNIAPAVEPRLMEASSISFYLYSTGHGVMGVSAYGKISDDQLEIIKRFKKVFELGYTRYIDVAQAEAQAKEARIETALERVRSRSMGMQKSDELKQVIQIMYEQFVHLNIDIEHTGFVVDYQPGGDWNFWIADNLGSPNKLKVADYDCAWNRSFDEAKKKGTDFFTTLLNFEEKNKFYSDLFAHAPGIEEHEKEVIFSKPGLAGSTVILADVALYIENFSGTPYTNEENATLMRFGKVFQQTYTRFLDLQKAEAQAKEGQIQLALERVRARTMAMQTSDELPEAANLLFQQAQSLGMPAWSAGYCIWGEDKKNITLWMSSEGVLQPAFSVPTATDPLFIGWREAAERGKQFLIQEVGGKELVTHYEYMHTLPVVGQVLDSIIEAGHPLPLFQINHLAYFQQGFLLFITYEPVPDAHDIFKRFAKVFEQTYTRFLDLKKAEAQAREGQIQLALERVRARTMAMQHSDELLETSTLLSQQFYDLGTSAHQISIGIINEQKGVVELSATVRGAPLSQTFDVRIDQPMVMQPTYNAWKEGKKSIEIIIKGEQLNEYNRLRNRESGSKFNFEEKGQEDQWIVNAVFFSRGMLTCSTDAPVTQETRHLLARFGSVFEQTYTRFLDLQKAEAQTREAQIEAALEKVRSSSLAVHKSNEFKEVIKVVFEKMQDLEISASAVSITLLNKGSKDTESYVCGLVDGEMDLRHYRLLYSDNSISNDLFNAQNSGLDFFTKTYGLEEKNIFYDYQFEFSGLKNAPDSVKQYVYQSKSYTISMAIAKHSMIVINDFEGKTPSENEVDIIKRFAKVFEQAYIRFLDVQKAEAQAKEGQIQLALERVRARTMAMQHSDELSETAYILFQQFNQLGENPDQATIGIVNEDEWVIEYWVTMYGDQTSKTFKFSIDEPNVTNRIYRAWKAGEKSRVIDLQGDELRDFSIYRAGMGGAAYNKDEQRRVVNVAFFAKGLINVQSAESRSAESILLLERFATVFEGTYQRFLDLKQAEAQAKEGQIQLALERVRARTMAMQHSEELSETAYLLSEQFRQFGEATIQITIGIIDEEHRVIEFAGTDTGGNKSVGRIKASIDQSGLMNKLYTAWKQKKKSAIVELRDDELVSWVNYRNSLMGRNEGLDQLDGARYVNSAFFSKGVMSLSALEPRSPEVIRLLERFAEVFDGTYTRFLDLKQAEAQAREAQIQLGLERVRARAMAMQTSNELADLVSTVLNELKKLDFALSWCLITIIDYDAWCCRVWMANPNVNQLPQSYLLQFADYPFQKAIMQAWKERQSKWVYELKGDEKKAIDEYMFTKTEYSKLPKVAQDNVRSLDPAYFSFSFSNFGGLQTGGAQPLSEDNLDILSRFGKVFDLTYTRFNDLQKAEAQAREALVEAALERVRSKTMAMHNSNDVAETAVAMVGELKKLGIDTIRCGIGIMHEPGDMEVWTVKTNENDEADMIIGWLDMHMHPLLEGAFISWRNNTEAYSYELKDEDLFNYFDAINKCPGYPIRYDTATLPKLIHHNEFHFSEGTLFSFSLQQISDEQKIIFKRFAGVFGLTYRRFLDLQKAESQAREAQIETGLERVRSRTLAMQSSEELAETAAVVFRQLINLGIEPNRLFIGIIKNESSDIELWATDEDGSKVSTRFTGNANGNKSVKEMYDGWKEGKSSITIDMQGKVLQDYFHYLTDTLHVPFKFGLDQKRRIQSVAYFSQGFIGMASPDVQPQSTIDLLERFAGVFNLTYTRFNDLQKAEAQAREAKIETALERVRARALAMQQPEELKEVAQVLRHEMGLLGIEELETCSIYMHADNSEDAECWYAIKDDKEAERKLVSDHFALNLTDTWVGMEMLKFYNSAIKQVSIAMKGANRKEWIHYCEDRSLVLRDYYGAQIPDRTYHLYKFSNGAIGAATPDNISGESWSLLKRVASVFSLAYSRFKDLTQARIDLKQLKEEKRRAEDALTELKAAQTKLIQTEKMASLGELTAGIAHEIQNPLNFVNNFSEVSIELLQELKEEAEAGNTEDVMAIAYDLTQNLGKINHHGKRADSIVKGMLEHSRVGTGEKQLTNINVMADEFLKLSYHGLRAKDKSFNAELTMKFDEQLPKINIAQQDIGRVLLNLFNNAFYAVNQKQKTEAADYKPEVSVSTSIEKSNLVIKVKDNGKGIPDAIKDKIMQPFFTTKPTGEGTGLGLSLSYDIVVKGHGGSISVDTKEGEGSEFIITLPL